MEVKFTYHEINRFKVNNSVACSTFIMSFNHHVCPVAKHFHNSTVNTCYPSSSHSPLLSLPTLGIQSFCFCELTYLDISDTWNHTICDLRYLASFTLA